MLKTAEVEIQKEHQVLMVNKTTRFNKQGKPKKKGNFKKGNKKDAVPIKKPKVGPKLDTDYFNFKGEGHWKLNCPKCLKSGQIKKKATSCLNLIIFLYPFFSINAFLSSSFSNINSGLILFLSIVSYNI